MNTNEHQKQPKTFYHPATSTPFPGKQWPLSRELLKKTGRQITKPGSVLKATGKQYLLFGRWQRLFGSRCAPPGKQAAKPGKHLPKAGKVLNRFGKQAALFAEKMGSAERKTTGASRKRSNALVKVVEVKGYGLTIPAQKDCLGNWPLLSRGPDGNLIIFFTLVSAGALQKIEQAI